MESQTERAARRATLTVSPLPFEGSRPNATMRAQPATGSYLRNVQDMAEVDYVMLQEWNPAVSMAAVVLHQWQTAAAASLSSARVHTGHTREYNARCCKLLILSNGTVSHRARHPALGLQVPNPIFVLLPKYNSRQSCGPFGSAWLGAGTTPPTRRRYPNRIRTG